VSIEKAILLVSGDSIRNHKEAQQAEGHPEIQPLTRESESRDIKIPSKPISIMGRGYIAAYLNGCQQVLNQRRKFPQLSVDDSNKVDVHKYSACIIR
jgi:hypothetical protein